MTPEWDNVQPFKIDGHSSHTLSFGDEDKFPWGWKVQKGRKLFWTFAFLAGEAKAA